MGEFEDLRASVTDSRARLEGLERELFGDRERARWLQRRLDRLSRVGGERSDDEIATLRRELAEVTASSKRTRGRLEEARRQELGVYTDFGRFTDPTTNIERLDDSHPILLFPVRIETRFKELDSGPELWVRVYPDDVAVDTFEDRLAEVELRNARSYWAHVWKAGGEEGERRAAWRSLVSSHGAGRAHWILGQFAPLNPEDEPVRAEEELVLVVMADTPLPDVERAPAGEYWRRLWLAEGDEAEVQAAFDALSAAVGTARAEVIRDDYVPVNLSERPATEPGIITVAFLDLPPASDVETQLQPWAKPARARALPERFVLMGYDGDQRVLEVVGRPVPDGLIVGPDPAAGPDEQIRLDEDGELVVPEAMRWIVDFDDALDKGMAFRVELDDDRAAAGFDQLFVLGVRIGSGIDQSRDELETLFRHHQASRKGLSIALQGTPTNNAEGDPSGYAWVEDPDLSYEHFFASDDLDDPSGWREKRDGRWLAEMLGIDPAVVRDSVHYFAEDQRDARAMNEALWPATLGYFMDRMMAPVFDDDTIRATRDFFVRHVTGRGAIPAIRVGSQPYGILPATPFSRMSWIDRRVGDDRPGLTRVARTGNDYLARLYAVLRKIDADWTDFAAGAAFVGKDADPHQVLLDVVGLHPTSAELHDRFAESEEQLVNLFRYYGIAAEFVAGLTAGLYTQSGLLLLERFGFVPEEPDDVPEILHKFFLSNADRLDGPVVDDRTLSEVEPIRAYRETGENYIEWLIEAVRTSHDTLRRQDGFLDDRPPSALLYLMLRHALDLGFVDTGIDLHRRAELLSDQEARVARIDPRFIHVQEPEEDRGTPWRFLYTRESAITGDPDRLVAEFIPTILEVERPYLQTQVEALERLASASTARLERAFIEHLDCCAYRFDAWMLGLVHAQLALMRGTHGDDTGAAATGEFRPGSWLGAFGWVEDVRPEGKVLEAVELPPDLAGVFDRPDEPTLMRDPTNGGHMLAPSLNHAVTAAVLRNGYLANATPEEPDTLAVNLSSERVRRAMSVIDGIRNGQSLAALLGYQLERGLHDAADLFLDDIIFDLRRAFPLVAGKVGETETDPSVPIEAIEARNVVDGLALVRKLQETGIETYPFGVEGLPDIDADDRREAVEREVERLLDTNDAVSDLALAESVHQVVQGNYDRAAGTADAYSKGNFPPLPDVVQTPRSGATLTHRFALHLEGGLDPTDSGLSTPRARAEPAVERWLESVLPDPADIGCRVHFFDRTADTTVTETISAADLGLAPSDLLYLVRLDEAQGMTALDDRILHHVATALTPRADSAIEIRYTEPVPGHVTFFELAPLIRALRACLLSSRPLRLTDMRLQGEASKEDDAGTIAVNEQKIAEARSALQDARAAWAAFVADMAGTLTGADDEAITASAVADIELRLAAYIDAASTLALFGFTNPGIGTSLEWRRARFAELTLRLDALIGRWEDKLDEYDLLLADYDALDPTTPDEDRFAALAALERVLTTEPEQPPPTTPAAFRTHITTVLRFSFDGVLTQLRGILDSAVGLSDAHADLDALVPDIAHHDALGLVLEDEREEIRRYSGDLLTRAELTLADIDERIARADGLLADSVEASSARRVEAATESARALLDPDFLILPEFTAAGDVGAELQNAWDDRTALLDHARTESGREFPADDWFYGVARVREKLGRFESVIMLAEAFGGGSLELDPLQLPFRSPDVWLGLEYPAELPGTGEPFAIEEDRLLYTAHFAVPFDTLQPHCGVLVDEWTEVVPTEEETAGLTFHYDRPNAEAPQALLLATPADFTGSWDWEDLVDAVRETLDLARKRAVEPAHIEATPYSRFLPAVVSSVTTYPLMQSLNLAYNNEIQFREVVTP